uniref:Uncharacterized protein n=1 Tax=Anguilla anguilla TaxID=7936 RepID=A0A0E9WA45_ANGAN
MNPCILFCFTAFWKSTSSIHCAISFPVYVMVQEENSRMIVD